MLTRSQKASLLTLGGPSTQGLAIGGTGRETLASNATTVTRAHNSSIGFPLDDKRLS